MKPVVKKTLGLTLMAFLALFMFFGPDSINVASADNDASITGVTNQDAPKVVRSLTGTIGAIVQWLYFLVVGFFAIKFLREKQYGQFWMFFLVALMVYTLIFVPDVLEALAGQIKTLFGDANAK